MFDLSRRFLRRAFGRGVFDVYFPLYIYVTIAQLHTALLWVSDYSEPRVIRIHELIFPRSLLDW